jgi:hypothetical protein
MPKIPLYNQGQAGSVKMATGSLGPRAGAAFEAPGRAFASLGQSVTNIATQFGLAEKKAETLRVSNESISTYGKNADDLVTNPKSRTVSGFDIESGEFRSRALADIDARGDLTSSQKDLVKQNLTRTLDRKFSIGRAAVFNKQQTERADIMNQGIESLISDSANKQLRPTVINDIQGLIDASKEQGLAINYDLKGVEFEIAKRDALADTTSNAIGLSELETRRDLILNGEGEYEKYAADERQTLASKYSSRINYLTGAAVAEADAKASDLRAGVAATGDDSGAIDLSQTYRALGQFDKAEALESDMIIGKKVFSTFDAIKFSPPEKVNEALRNALAIVRDPKATDSERAENLEVYKQLSTKITAMKQAINDDAVGYIESIENRTLSVSERIEKQRMLGVEENKIVPFSMAEFKEFKTSIETDDPIFAMQEMDKFFDRYGENALPSAMRNGMTYAQNIAFVNKEKPRAIDLLASTQVEDSVIRDKLKEKNIKETDIEAEVNEELSEWSNSVIGGTSGGMLSRMGGPARYNAVMETEMAVGKLAKLYVTRGMSIGDAKKAAANLVTGRYVFKEFNDTTIRIPAVLDTMEDTTTTQIAAFLEDRLNDNEYLSGTVFFKPGGTDATEAETAQYIKEVSSMGGWVTLPNDTGVYLVDQTGNKVIKRVPVDGKMMEMPVVVDFRDILGQAAAAKTYGVVDDETAAEKGKAAMEQLRLR